MLPDNVLLEIFDFYRKAHDYTRRTVWKWHLLVHVCRSWRQIIFASPHRLHLQILCTHGTPVRKNLGIWPAFPIVIDYRYCQNSITHKDEDNIITALKHLDRVCFIWLAVTGLQLGKLVAMMQEPFPVLTRLYIFLKDRKAPPLPTGFLGRSAPCLEKAYLHGISFPALPTLLLSASDLVTLALRKIRPTGYITPKAMVACLAALPRLDTFHIGFISATSRPDRIHLPPVTRTVLPALTCFKFQGASEYLEDLISRVDSPQLNQISIGYLNQLVEFRAQQLSKFLDRSVRPKLTQFNHVHVTFASDKVTFEMCRHANYSLWDCRPVTVIVSCKEIDWQVSHMAQVLGQISATLSNVIHLKLKAEIDVHQLKGTENIEWLHLLHQFSTMQSLHVSRELAGQVTLALEHITGEMAFEAFPSLNLIRMVGQPASSLEKFVAARRFSNCPVTVVNTKTEFNRRLESYIRDDHIKEQ